jgi:protein TonB
MKKILLLLALFSFQFVQAQTKDTTTSMILLEAEIMPEFIGGDEAMYDYIGSNLNYPKYARRKKMEAKVLVRFAIMQDGTTDHIEILSKTPEIFNVEVIKLIKSMPKWKPGMQEGKPVPIYYSIPISFRLQ